MYLWRGTDSTLTWKTEEGKRFLEENLRWLARHGASLIRLDAFAYAVKRPGTSCFFVEPDIWELLERCAKIAAEEGAQILPEIHEHFSIQQKLACRDYYVYDFALPMLLLHAIYFKNSEYLKHWFEICPRKQFTTLDTHDGIGVVDVRGLLPDEEIEAAKEHLFEYGANVKRVYNTEKYNNLDIYQINCTYYSALGDDDNAYLLAELRGIQDKNKIKLTEFRYKCSMALIAMSIIGYYKNNKITMKILILVMKFLE